MSSPSLRSETVVGPNGAVTTRAAVLANEKWSIGDTKRIEGVTDGVYLKEALQIEGGMQFKGQPLTIDAIRKFFGTPTAQALAAASVDDNLQFVHYLVDPRKAEARRQTFTLAVVGDSRMRRLELRNGVLVITDAAAAAPTHLAITPGVGNEVKAMCNSKATAMKMTTSIPPAITTPGSVETSLGTLSPSMVCQTMTPSRK